MQRTSVGVGVAGHKISTSVPPLPPGIWTAYWILCARRRRHEKFASSRFLFLLPSLIFVGLFAFYPIFESFRLSFYRSILTLPWLGQKMVGWQNYTDLWTDPRSSPVFAHHPVFRCHDHSAGTRHRPRHGAGDERSFSWPRAASSRGPYSLGISHSRFLPDVALHLQ